MDNPFEIISQRLSNIESLILDVKHNNKLPAGSEVTLDTLQKMFNDVPKKVKRDFVKNNYALLQSLK